MTPRTEIIENKVVNSVPHLVNDLKQNDLFRKPRGKATYRFIQLNSQAKTVDCENLDTQLQESIYFQSPVFKLVFLT
jgi:hypothetical protein